MEVITRLALDSDTTIICLIDHRIMDHNKLPGLERNYCGSNSWTAAETKIRDPAGGLAIFTKVIPPVEDAFRCRKLKHEHQLSDC